MLTAKAGHKNSAFRLLQNRQTWLWKFGAIQSQVFAKLSISQMLSHFLDQPNIMINEKIAHIIHILLISINCIK